MSGQNRRGTPDDTSFDDDDTAPLPASYVVALFGALAVVVLATFL
ncbi:hypothetical protein [Pinisolibacter sp.]